MSYKNDVENYIKFINDAKIVNTMQSDLYFKINEIDETKKENILKTAARIGGIYLDEQSKCICSSRALTYKNFTTQHCKTIWLLLYLMQNEHFDFVNLEPKLPAVLYTVSINEEVGYYDRTVFYISSGNVKLTERIIETNYGGLRDKIPTTIIVDNFDYIEDIALSDKFDVKEIYSVSEGGEVIKFETL